MIRLQVWFFYDTVSQELKIYSEIPCPETKGSSISLKTIWTCRAEYVVFQEKQVKKICNLFY